MSVDILAFSKVEFLEVLPDTESWENKYWVNPDNDTDYVPSYRYYAYRMPPIVKNGVYRIRGDSDSVSMGYAGYNWWREWLCLQVNGIQPDTVWGTRDDAATMTLPFYELIDFADNEGVIGTIAAAELARDFAEWQDKVNASSEERFREVYGRMRRLFEIAANGGYVRYT